LRLGDICVRLLAGPAGLGGFRLNKDVAEGLGTPKKTEGLGHRLREVVHADPHMTQVSV
jgi:hypothetical protein